MGSMIRKIRRSLNEDNVKMAQTVIATKARLAAQRAALEAKRIQEQELAASTEMAGG